MNVCRIGLRQLLSGVCFIFSKPAFFSKSVNSLGERNVSTLLIKYRKIFVEPVVSRAKGIIKKYPKNFQ
jgi:hypothetical protein